MNQIVGFVHIDKNATTCAGAKNPNEFIGQTCAVMEFDSDGGVLCLNPQQTALAMFDKEDVYRSFKCIVSGNTICPPKVAYFCGMYPIAVLHSARRDMRQCQDYYNR